MQNIEFNSTMLGKFIDWSFVLYLISLYIFEFNVSLLWITHVFFIIFSSLVFVKIFKQGKFFIGKYLTLPLCYLLYALTNTIWATSSDKALSRFLTLILVFLLYILIYNAFNGREKLNLLIKAHFIAGIALSIYSIFFFGWNNIITALLSNIRLGGDISQANVFGMQLATTVIICFYYLTFHGKKIMIPISIIPFILAMASGSRKTLIILTLGIIILLFLKFGARNLIKAVISISILLTSFYMLLQLPLFNNVLIRFEGVYAVLGWGGQPEASAEVRQMLIDLSWNLFKQKPFFGNGLNSTSSLIFNVIGLDTYSHNNFIEVLVDGGIIGLFAFYQIYFYIIYKNSFSISRKSVVTVIILTLLIIRFVLDYASVSYYEKSTWIFFAIGFLSISENRNKFKSVKDIVIDSV